MNLAQIGQIALTVRDIERATSFYGGTLGLRPLFRAGGLSFFDCQGVRLMLSEPEPGRASNAPAAPSPTSRQASAASDAAASLPPPPTFMIYFRVDDITAAHRHMLALGVTFVEEPHLVARMPDHELWLTSFSDGEGNTLALMEERRG